MNVLVVSTCAELLSENEFVMPILRFCPKASYAHWSAVDEGLLRGADKIIICGTALADFDYLNGKWAWLKACEIPVLGICAGAQVIAKEFGWKLTKTRRIGVQKVEVVKDNPLLEKDSSGYFLHSYDLTGGDVLATSEKVPALLKVKGKRIFACVFHPEVMTESIITNFIAKDLNK